MKSRINKNIFERTSHFSEEEVSAQERNERISNPEGAGGSDGTIVNTAVVEEVRTLVDAIKAGRLDVRADLSGTSGTEREILEGINEMLDAVINPLNVTAEYIDRISKGDIPEKITDDYKGDFNEIKNNLNMLIDALNKVSNIAQEIADGNLTIEVEERSAQDVLMKSLAQMVDNLKNMAVNLRTNADNLASSAQQLSANTEETTAGINETSSSMSEIASTMDQVARNAQVIKEASDQAANEAERGQEYLKTVDTQMNSISEATHNAAGVVQELKNASGKIGKIVETISGIADQTNLLALNAAIEAARAGEHGRGFAVVAEEVRKLAMQSANATSEIQELISNIQNGSNKAVEVMNENLDKVESGVKVVNEAVESFAQIINRVKELTAQVEEIASGTEQVSAAVQNVTSTMQESTTAVEEIASSTEMLTRMATELQQVAAQFKVN